MKAISLTSCTVCTVAAMIAVVFLLAGCGGGGETPDLGEVYGKVTLDDEPLAGALVTFQPESGRPSTAETDENGEYTLSYSSTHAGAKVGQHSVRITKIDVSGTTEEGEPIEKEIVPAKYNVDSELTRLKENGEIYALQEKWFGFEMTLADDIPVFS